MSVIVTIIASCLSVIVIVLGFVYKTSRWVTKQEEENKDIRSDTAHKIEKAKSDCMHCIDLEKEKMTAMKERIDRHIESNRNDCWLIINYAEFKMKR